MITSADIRSLYNPSRCPKRVWLAANREDLVGKPSEYDQLLMEQGQQHEQAHLATLPPAMRPSYPPGNFEIGAQATKALMDEGVAAIYQGVVRSEKLGIVGIPDFLIRVGDNYTIRDAKLAVKLNAHPEIALQVSLYADAFTDMIGDPPVGLEVALGDGTVSDVEHVPTTEVIHEILSLQDRQDEPDEAVGWSKCEPCPFGKYCWEKAEESRDVATVYGVDQSLSNVLHDMGVATFDDLVSLAPGSLAEIRRPHGDRMVRVGKRAPAILRQARVLIADEYERFAQPELPGDGPVVYFDIESDPHDEVGNKVYLWGVLTDRGDGSEPTYWGEVAGAGKDEDERAWFSFLDHAGDLMDEQGDLPFVHYSPYERTWVAKYIERFGDPDGTAERVMGLLFDMRPRTILGAYCFPVPSYGLKAIEKQTGFERSQEEYGSLWSVVCYHRWLAAEGDERERLGRELLTYNEEDCAAMKWVVDWVREDLG